MAPVQFGRSEVEPFHLFATYTKRGLWFLYPPVLMQVLLIGATGQIGTALLHALTEASFDVRVLVRDKSRLSCSQEIDVLSQRPFSREVFGRALEGIDHVIYGVGRPEQFLFDPSGFRRVNYGLLRRFLPVLAQSSCERLTYISTYEVFEEREGKVRVSHPVAEDTRGMTPYFAAMAEAYRTALEFSKTHRSTRVTTIHPAAVYGGRNTGQGITDYIENLIRGQFWRVPFIIEGRFPVVHAASLAEAIVGALGRPGSFIVSDEMTSLHEIALTLRRMTGSYVPPVAPVWAARLGAAFLEQLANLTKKPPIMSTVQVRFLTRGLKPLPEKAAATLDWRPMLLEEGLRRYVESRPTQSL